MEEHALSGLKVLEFGEMVSVPYCGKLMADLGAEVIKIEKPEQGDEARRRGPFAENTPGLEKSGLFSYLNTNKLSITLNMESQEGKDIFFELIKQADILLENNPPAVMKKMGLNYEALEKINPSLIMTSITSFGQTGPYKDYKAYELNNYNSGGYGYLSTVTYEEPVRPPVKAGGRQSQFGAGIEGAVATMCALFARELIGEGQHIDISIMECLAGQFESQIEYWTIAKNEMGGVSHPIIQPMLPLPCKDGWVFLMCVQDHEFDKLVEVMGNPDWAQMELFENRFTRADYVDVLKNFLIEWSMQYTKKEIFKMAQEGRVPLAPAYTAEEVVNSEHLATRQYFVVVDHPEIGKAKYPGAPYAFSQTPWKIDRHAPLLGEHNGEIFQGRFGYSDKKLEELRETGVI